MALTRITKGVIKPNENYDTHNIVSTGIVTAIGLDINGNADISGNFSVGGVLTYEDVTSIDSVGVITARNGIDCNADLDVDGHTNLDNVSIAGVTTFASNINLGDSDKIRLGDGSDLQLFHDGTRSHLSNSTGELRLGQGGTHVELYYGNVKCFHTHADNGGSVGLFRNLTATDNVEIRFGASGDYRFFHEGSSSKNVITCTTNGLEIRKNGTTEVAAKFIADGATELYHDNVKRLETSSVGVSIPQDLDVDGHTNLDNVSVAGVITATTFIGDGSNLSGLASREVYGFTGIGNSLSLTTTNNGADNIDNATYVAFEESFIGPSGISFSINTSGNLIMTV